MKKSKVLLLALCAAALSVGVTFGTLAYLTDTEAVTNIVTVGQVHISLDETDVDDTDKDGNTTERDKSNEYHLIPGQTYPKDPIVHVRADSESCWVFVKVENGISAIETTEADKTVAAQIAANGWAQLKDENGKDIANVFYKKWEKPTGTVADSYYDLPVFQNFKIKGDGVDNTAIANHSNSKIIVTAYAIQAAGFENNVSGAWAAFVNQNADLFG